MCRIISKNALTFSDIIKAESKELELVMNYYGLTLPKLIEKFNIREIVVTSGKSGGYVMSNSLEKQISNHILLKKLLTQQEQAMFFLQLT